MRCQRRVIRKESGAEIIHKVHDPGNRPPVSVQRMRIIGALRSKGRREARVSPLEPHDGLFAVSHQDDAGGGLDEMRQKGELNGVGVLEFVHDHAVDSVHHGRDSLGAGAQKGLCPGDHVAEIHHAEPLLGLREQATHLLCSRQQHLQALGSLVLRAWMAGQCPSGLLM